MNFGFYIKSLSNEKQLNFINNTIASAIDDNGIDDYSLFYDGVGFIPYIIPCGLFNSTDLWNFNGNLVVMNSDCAKKAIKIVNNIKIFYYYGWEDIDVFSLLYLKNSNVNFICTTNDESKKLYRLTGKYADFIINHPENILKNLVQHE